MHSGVGPAAGVELNVLCVIPFDNAYADAVCRLLEWCAELSGRVRHPCLLVMSRDTTEETFRRVMQRAHLAFSGVNAIKPGVVDQHRNPETVNLLFRTAVRYIEKVSKQPFFWCEVDCVPLVADWMDRLEAEYFVVGKPYMGFKRDIPFPHISAPAIYPAQVSKFNPATLLDFHNHHGCISFDLVAADKTLKHAHVTKLIHHEWGAKDKPPTFPDQASMGMISKDAVLFHRVKIDGGLIERLRELRPKPVIESSKPNAVGESLVAEQTEPEPANLKVAVIYVYPALGGQHDFLARRFAESYAAHFPVTPHTLYVVSNGGDPTPTMRQTFATVQCEFLVHDDTGFDIGAYRKAAREVPADLMVFFGGASYLKGPRWLERMVEAYEKHGPALYGCTGSLGHTVHIRTTGLWCEPKLINSYPHPTTSEKESRYAFEHGQNSLTQWAFKQGLKALVVTWTNEVEWQGWDQIVNGFQQGDQSALLAGDRLTGPEYQRPPQAVARRKRR